MYVTSTYAFRYKINHLAKIRINAYNCNSKYILKNQSNVLRAETEIGAARLIFPCDSVQIFRGAEGVRYILI